MARVEFKFSKDFPHGNRTKEGKPVIDKKGSARLVTEKAAKFLERNKYGAPTGKKENKEAAGRDTK